MKILIFPLIILVCAILLLGDNRPGKAKKTRGRRTIYILTVSLLVFVLALVGFYRSQTALDTYCTTVHPVTYFPPQNLVTPADFFEQANYDFDRGLCSEALFDYTNAVNLDPKFAQAYNNRGYTYMRLRKYDKALFDLNSAIALRPSYINALMNRGDLYNYYGPVFDRQKAVADYEQVIAFGGGQETSVCGHLFLARHNGWNLGTILAFPTEVMNCK